MKYLFQPAHPGAGPASAREAGKPMKAGNVYDIDPEWAAHVGVYCKGVDGAPCLVPIEEEKPKAKPGPKPSAATEGDKKP